MHYQINHLTQMKTSKTLIGHCAVDSGSLMIVDPCYVLNDEKTSVEKNGLYQAGVDIILKKKFGEVIYSGVGGKGIITTTFDGDGSYPVYAEVDQNGLPRKIVIDLCP